MCVKKMRKRVLVDVKGDEYVQQRHFDDTIIKQNIVLSPNSSKKQSDGEEKRSLGDDDDVLHVNYKYFY